MHRLILLLTAVFCIGPLAILAAYSALTPAYLAGLAIVVLGVILMGTIAYGTLMYRNSVAMQGVIARAYISEVKSLEEIHHSETNYLIQAIRSAASRVSQMEMARMFDNSSSNGEFPSCDSKSSFYGTDRAEAASIAKHPDTRLDDQIASDLLPE